MAASVRAVSAISTTVDPTLTHALPSSTADDHLYLFVVAYSKLADVTAPTADWTVPDGWDLAVDLPVVESSTTVGRFGLLCRVVTTVADGTVTVLNPCVSTASQLLAWSVSIRDVGGSPGSDVVTSGPVQTANLEVPGMSVLREDTVVLQAFNFIGNTFGGVFEDLGGPYTWVAGSLIAVLHGFQTSLYRTLSPQDADVAERAHHNTAPTLAGGGGPGWYAIITIALVPALEPTPPVAPPDFRRLRLGCADDYRVFITSNDYRTVIDGVGWSDVEWSRVLDESSTATVTLPDRYGGARCCADLGGLMPWRYGLLIERDDVEVWSGPVTNIQRAPEALRVSASDVMARFQKRLAWRGPGDLRFDMLDAGAAFGQIAIRSQFRTASGVFTEPWNMLVPEATTGSAIKRDILVREFELAWDILSDFAESSVDFWVGNGVLYMFDVNRGWVYHDGTGTAVLDGPYSPEHELVYGTFTESTFADLPTWTINGWAQTNTAWVPGPDAGESGARRYWTATNPVSISYDGVLDSVEVFNLYRPEDEEDIPNDVFQDFADSLVAVRGNGPPVIEGTVLSQNAPIDVDNLRPGSIWQVDIFDACYGQLLQAVRLKRVTVRASKTSDGGLTETVEPVLVPLGHEED